MHFELDVLQRSESIPVVVDFWAAWCGPCRVLGPIIESLAANANGRWELVKVDTEAHPDLMQHYRIQGIPAVKMFFKREVIAEFTGALPAPQIQAWLDEHIPSPEKEAWLELKENLAWPPNAEQFSIMQERAEEWKGIEDFVEHLWRAQALLNPEDVWNNPPKNLEWNTLWSGFQWWPKNEDPYMRWKLLWQEMKWEDLIETLLQPIMLHQKERENARLGLVLLFALLGKDHALSVKYRRRFSMALY